MCTPRCEPNPDGPGGKLPGPSREEQRARAAMCCTCPHARRRGGKSVACTVSGHAVRWHVTAPVPACPKGRHGWIVRWLGIRWYGVPMPIRLRLRRQLTGPLPGCGCVKVLKDLADRRAVRELLSLLLLLATAIWVAVVLITLPRDWISTAAAATGVISAGLQLLWIVRRNFTGKRT